MGSTSRPEIGTVHNWWWARADMVAFPEARWECRCECATCRKRNAPAWVMRICSGVLETNGIEGWFDSDIESMDEAGDMFSFKRIADEAA